MIYGERGVGKSILVRKVIKDISEEDEKICITIDGNEARDPEDLLRDICKKLASGLREYFLQKTGGKIDKKIEREIVSLDYISDANLLKESNIKTIAERIEGEVGQSIGLLDFLSFRAKIAASEGSERGEAREIEQIIDTSFLIKLLEKVIDKIQESLDTDILIYVDNLDQLENKDSIDDFVTEIIKLKKAILVVSIRREVADRNIGRDFKEVELIKALTPEELVDVFEYRLKTDCPKKKELLDTDLPYIVDTLKGCTGNPLSFLTWLHYLIVDSEIDRSNILENLRGFTKTHYSTFDEAKIRNIAKYYISRDSEFISKKDFTDNTGIDSDMFDMLLDFGVIVPDNKYSPRLFKVSSDFMFYRLEV